MVLTKEELRSMLQNEVRILLHLIYKVIPENLDFRPTPQQRSTLELLQYLTIMGPIHMDLAKSGVFEMEAWGKQFTARAAAAAELDLEQVRSAIEGLAGYYEEILASCTDADFREVLTLFGAKSSRGAWMVSLVLNHHVAYRMQVFQYLKASGREELNTMNLWVGMDSPMKAG